MSTPKLDSDSLIDTGHSNQDVEISSEEVSSIDTYIKQKNTAVLVTMFTDIQGFTLLTEEKGEAYSAQVRKFHDDILVSTIEENGEGSVIKFIGDAVMAVFAEPSAAVEKALLIQERIKAFNESHAEFENILVRIGLHMGQVAMENNIQVDVFGRHVNRAARIEGLTAGGQVFMSYPVFDSAKGWLTNNEHLKWASHGCYYLKGIEDAVEVYEAYDERHTQPRPPEKGNKKRTIPKAGISIALVFLGCLLMFGVFQFKKTEVWMVSFFPDEMFVDGTELVAFKGKKGDREREIATEITSGRHILHYDVHEGTRYFAEVDLSRGKNIIKPTFVESRLPLMTQRIGVKKDVTANEKKSRAFRYITFNKAGKKESQTIDLDINMISVRNESGVIDHKFEWKLLRNGLVLKEGVVKDQHAIDGRKTKRVDKALIYEEGSAFFFYEYYMAKEFAEFTLGAHYIKYQ